MEDSRSLLTIGDMRSKPFEAYYVDLQDRVFGISSLIDYKFFPNREKALVNKSAISEPPIKGLYESTFDVKDGLIEITVGEPRFDEGIDYNEFISVYQKKIILRKKTN